MKKYPSSNVLWLLRIAASIPSSDLIATVTCIFTLLGVIAVIYSAKIDIQPFILFLLITVPFVAIIILGSVLVLKTIVEYQRRTNDITLISAFDERFQEMKAVRDIASTICKRYLANRSWIGGPPNSKQIEPTIDFFEDLGNAVLAGNISEKMAWHYFYHWIRGYYPLFEEYIANNLKVNPLDDSAWHNIKPLWLLTSEIEIKEQCKRGKNAKTNLDYAEQLNFLHAELVEHTDALIDKISKHQ